MPTVLLTGFEPFDGDTINPSWECVQALHGTVIAGATVVAVQLPCVFGKSITALRRALRQHQPDIVIAVGQAGGRMEITPERVAINLDDARIPDNAGKRPLDKAITPGGPAAYFSTLPIKAIVAALQAQGLPASISHSAGTFVCNHVFYALMALQEQHKIRSCGFMHIPFLPEQAARRGAVPSMSANDIVRSLRIAIETSVQRKKDLRAAGGTTH